MVGGTMALNEAQDAALTRALHAATPSEWTREGTSSQGAHRRAQWERWAREAPERLRLGFEGGSGTPNETRARNALCNGAARVMGTETEPDEDTRTAQWDLIWKTVHGQGEAIRAWCDAEGRARRHSAAEQRLLEWAGGRRFALCADLAAMRRAGPCRVVAVHEHESGYTPTDIECESYADASALARALNTRLGWSDSEVETMVARSMGSPGRDR